MSTFISSLSYFFAMLPGSPLCLYNVVVSNGLLPRFLLYKLSDLELWPLAPLSAKVSVSTHFLYHATGLKNNFRSQNYKFKIASFKCNSLKANVSLVLSSFGSFSELLNTVLFKLFYQVLLLLSVGGLMWLVIIQSSWWIFKKSPENSLLSIQIWNQQTNVLFACMRDWAYSYSAVALHAVELSWVWIKECWQHW